MSNFKVGDFVSVVDENVKGKILHITSHKITIEDEDGFDYTYPSNKIVACSLSIDFNEIEKKIDKIIAEKEDISPSQQSKKNLEKNSLEIDLHIHAITDHYKYLSNYEMLCIQLDTAKSALNKANPNKTKSITFIHGKGTGKLKKELEHYLNREQYEFYPAKHNEYGEGALTVEIKKRR